MWKPSNDFDIVACVETNLRGFELWSCVFGLVGGRGVTVVEIGVGSLRLGTGWKLLFSLNKLVELSTLSKLLELALSVTKKLFLFFDTMKVKKRINNKNHNVKT